MTRVVHLLAHGAPVCGFMRGVPSEWPEGHVWVSAFDPHQVKLATCLGCQRAHAVASSTIGGRREAHPSGRSQRARRRAGA